MLEIIRNIVFDISVRIWIIISSAPPTDKALRAKMQSRHVRNSRCYPWKSWSNTELHSTSILVTTVIADGTKSKPKFKYAMRSGRWRAERLWIGRKTKKRGRQCTNNLHIEGIRQYDSCDTVLFRQREHRCRTPRTSGSVVPVRRHEYSPVHGE